MQNRMTTSQQQTSVNGEDEWMSSLEAFRASLSVTPGDEEARKMTATSGRQCIAPSMKSSPLGLWLKTLLESSRWSSRARFLRWQAQPLFSTRLTTFEDDTNSVRPLPCNASAQTLKVTDMPSSRCLFRLVPSEPPTDETGCSSSQGVWLPTPKASDNSTGIGKDEEPYLDGNIWRRPNGVSMRLSAMANRDMLPTPQTQGLKVCDENGKTQFIDLDLLPTPRANVVNGCDLNNPTLANRNKSNLEEEVAKMLTTGLLGTVTATSGCRTEKFGKGRNISPKELARKIAESTESDNAGKTSRLSPLFTEEMMGFPLMWTALPFLSESGAPKPSKPTATR